MQETMDAERLAGSFIVSRRGFVPVVVGMTMIRLQGDGVLQIMEVAEETQHRLHHHAECHQRQQGDA